MKLLRLFRCISATCIFITLLSLPAAAFAKRPTPPEPEPEPTPTPAPIGTIELVSKSSDGIQGNNQSYKPAMTPDGRYVLFISTASNLVANDTNAQNDVFVHDRLTGLTERVNVASDETQTDKSTYYGSISDDGRFAAFVSSASTLVAGEQTTSSQVYVHDRLNGTTERISVSIDGTPGNSNCYRTTISADGRYVGFESHASNLVIGDTNGNSDIFVRDRLTGTTELISVASDGGPSNRGSGMPDMSADGQTLAFISHASNLVPDDTNNVSDIFVHNRVSGLTERVSIATNGTQSNASSGGTVISADGNVVSFSSSASNLVSNDTTPYYDVFVHDRTTGTTERVSKNNDGLAGNDESFSGDLSADGRYVAFFSYANNLDMPYSTANWWYSNVFVYDRVLQKLEQIDHTPDGLTPSDDSSYPVISADGRFVSFESYASDLLSVDNGSYTNDIFIWDRNQ